ncbi:TonB-dependent receptor [Dyella nitratireducens]|uniref:TonB-dependent receptor n=1 Tax=Dyella nitratireducens TaxID=1849580 RepID=A0ABQ1FQJ4_9GAMM|nr:TonB-dependent receptor [Dyella nitratireducens]GGA26711.1 TonB-dependent receptor [Dyella nitratireducens]GLQ43514.1 TonB-dependent receptor [Dyella nitratireducens]
MQKLVARTMLSRALTLALLGAASAAYAQDTSTSSPAPAQNQAPANTKNQAQPSSSTQPKQLATVNVSGGYRNSIEFSTNAKRDATNVVDTVYAEDIGKFPDLNIAESLNRVPGVQLTRDVDGEGKNIQIRGLGTDFTKILLNGNQISVASAGTLNAQNQNREVDLDLLPTEFFTQLTVNKTPQADMTEGGVAGVVDMRTTRPFDNPGTHLTYSAQASYGSVGKDVKPRGAIIGSWTNASNTFGVLVGLQASQNDYDVRGFETVGWTTPHLSAAQCGIASGSCSPAGSSWFVPGTVPAGAGAGLTAGQTIDNAWLLAHNPGLNTEQIANALIPRLARQSYIQGIDDHQSGLLSFEFRPDERAHFYFDSLFSKKENDFNRLDMDLVGRNGAMIPVNMQVDKNNVVTSATFANAQYFLEAEPYSEHLKFYNLNPGGELLFGSDENIKLDFQGYVQRSWYLAQKPSFLVQTPLGQGTTVSYSDNGGNYPIITPSVNLNNPNLGWQYYRVNVQNEARVTTNKGTREDLQIGEDDSNIRVGIAYDDIARNITAFDNSTAYGNEVQAKIPNGAWSQYLSPGPYGFIQANYPALMNATNYGYYYATAPLTTAAASGANTSFLEESSWAWYLEGNHKFDLWGHDLRANVGIRHAYTDQTIAGPSSIGGQLQYVNLKHDYGAYLPSFNLAYNATDNVILRLAGSRSLTRPDPSAMVPNTNFSDPSAETATQGNPKLAPYISTNLDFGGEWYTGSEGYVALDLFGKRINGFTVNGVNLIPFTQLGVPYASLTPQQQVAIQQRGGPNAAVVQVQQQVNADGTLFLRGAEATWVQPLDFIYKGLGIQTNYTVVSQRNIGSGVPAQAVGISPHTYNLTGYWEGYGTTVRVSYTWNSDAIASTLNQNGLPFGQIKQDARGQLDMSASYEFAHLPSKPMVTLNFINMTKASLRQTFTYSNATYTYYSPGYTILLGVRGSF